MLVVKNRAALRLIVMCAGMLLVHPLKAELPCAKELQIIESFDTGAAWQMCRQNKSRENLVLSDISYKPPNGSPYHVMGSMQLSQLHVTYDDGNVTYNDVTQYGLGGEFMSTLLAGDCPGGDLLPVDGRPGICLTRERDPGTHTDDQFRNVHERAAAHSFTLTSVSQVGSYAYIASWRFFADGSIHPAIGAAGALQRSTTDVNSPFGRQLEGATDQSWLSHTHNYYWRLDFDLGERDDDDFVRERTLLSQASGHRRQQLDTLNTEAARETAAGVFRSWEIVDGGSGSSSGSVPAQHPSFALEPIDQGHKHVRAEREPYTQYDFFVTRQNDCERFASQNTRFNPGCADDVLGFVNGESLQNQDIVVWHRVSFHHVPRNEDQNIMHSHWDGFTLRPRYLHSSTPGHSGNITNSAPVVLPLPDQQHSTGEPVSIPVQAEDADLDPVQISINGLPDGIYLAEDQVIRGSATTAGEFDIHLVANDGIDSTSSGFQWQITAKKKSGSLYWYELLMLVGLLHYLPRYRSRQE